jgi:hypothetical protein
MWRILEWSRELGRGAIGSAHFARVEFDARCADVDDFTIGEPVHVELEGTEAPMRVRRVWPDMPRFRARPGTLAAPLLDEALRAETEAILAGASGWTDARIQFAPGRIRIELDDDAFAYGPSAALDLFDPSYVELPAVLEPRFVRLADPPARSYLGTRVELSALDIAITVIDQSDRFYFVVVRRLSFTSMNVGAPKK